MRPSETVVAQGELGKLADNRGARPLLRGWLHLVAFAGWLVGGPFLIAAGPDVGAKAALTVYVAGMLAMFGISAAFHRIRWSAGAWRRMRRADHSAIFVGIAGTATAVAVVVVAVELGVISYVRHRYMDTPFLAAAFQVVVGGVLVFATGILIGSS